MNPRELDEASSEFEAQVQETGVLIFYSNYGRHEVNISIGGDADIHEVGEALRAFLLATGFSESTVAQILELET